MKLKSVNTYKRRSVRGADSYGQFREGRQITADKIAGATVWHEWRSVAWYAE